MQPASRVRDWEHWSSPAPLWPSPNSRRPLPEGFTPLTQRSQLPPPTGRKAGSVMRNHYKFQAL